MTDPTSPELKIGVVLGGGPPPGYLWNVALLSMVYPEAMEFLTNVQYQHLAEQVRLLAGTAEPTSSDLVDVRPIEDFYELRDKGGVLGKINARVFFAVLREQRTLLVLGSLNKQNDGKTPHHNVVTVRSRLQRYRRQLG
ncbi:MAG: hypothetical protein ACRCZF_22685 [Gemmataceae bacterium]